MKRFLNWLRPKSTVRVQIIQRDPLRMSMEEWRSNPELCRKAELALKDPVVRQMLDVLWHDHIARWVPSKPGDVLLACRAEGWNLALNAFESLAKHEKPIDNIPVTYGADEEVK